MGIYFHNHGTYPPYALASYEILIRFSYSHFHSNPSKMNILTEFRGLLKSNERAVYQDGKIIFRYVKIDTQIFSLLTSVSVLFNRIIR